MRIRVRLVQLFAGSFLASVQHSPHAKRNTSLRGHLGPLLRVNPLIAENRIIRESQRVKGLRSKLSPKEFQELTETLQASPTYVGEQPPLPKKKPPRPPNNKQSSHHKSGVVGGVVVVIIIRG